uniref:Uncharacterized protein n=1 Tax=Rhizophagus irregularis (strain DAOM 181602 / DAOM 197198 / MUCL 43194) TaxID=747089 RepID=U9SFY3_RHIID
MLEFVEANKTLVQEQANTSIMQSHPQAYYTSRKFTEILTQEGTQGLDWMDWSGPVQSGPKKTSLSARTRLDRSFDWSLNPSPDWSSNLGPKTMKTGPKTDTGPVFAGTDPTLNLIQRK